MFADIRRHQKWLWIVISGAVIISFVWYFNPNQRNGGAGIGLNSSVGTLNGRPIGRNEYFAARKEAELRYLFTYGSWHGSDEFSRQNPDFIERETRNRLVLKEKVKEYHIEVTPTDVARWIAEAFSTKEKGFNEADLDRFMKSTLEPRGYREADLERYVRDELAIAHLVQVAGVAGKLVTPQEAEDQYRRENEQVAAQAVFFNATNYVAQVKLEPASISAHYTNQAAMYRIPERVQLSYVAFPASNYFANADQALGTVTNLNQMIDEMYRQRGTNYYTDTNGAPLSAEAAKARIKGDERQRLALVEARKAAVAFAQELLDLPGARNVSNLENLAAAKGMPVKQTDPFTQYEGPKGLEVPDRFSQSAFMLSPADPFFEEPVVGADAVFVAGLKKRIPSEVPALDTIREKVTEDYKRMQSQTLARQAGMAFVAKLTNAIAGGKTFAAAAAELGQKPTTLEPFSQTSRTIGGLDPRVDPSSVKNAAFALKAGETSPFTLTRDGGFVIHVDKFIPATDESVKAALPGYLANLQRGGQVDAFNAWFTKEIQGAKLSLVTDRSRSSKNGPPSQDEDSGQ